MNITPPKEAHFQSGNPTTVENKPSKKKKRESRVGPIWHGSTDTSADASDISVRKAVARTVLKLLPRRSPRPALNIEDPQMCSVWPFLQRSLLRLVETENQTRTPCFSPLSDSKSKSLLVGFNGETTNPHETPRKKKRENTHTLKTLRGWLGNDGKPQNKTTGNAENRWTKAGNT